MTQTEKILETIHFGVDYYPEHWPESRWETDAKLMKEMGIQVVRMAEFAWHELEPEKDHFCFEWLDRAIELLGRYGIYTVLGTPTAAPPAWMVQEYPEILPVDSRGYQKGFGGRHHDCQSNPVYRERIRRLVRAMAEHYKENPYVVGWQIDNELGNSHMGLCMCDSCKNAFHGWLEEKYQRIETLNEAWGTVFWSQTYDDFEQIPVPKETPTVHNPSLLLDWKRFCSDLVIDFQKMQISIIREIAPHQKITHNLMGFYDKSDYFKSAGDLDFASNDQYPTGYYLEGARRPAYEMVAAVDFIRSLKKQNIWMMELESGPTGGSVIGATPRPGENRIWTAQCVAHGADAIVYFRWRTCRFGAEQFWHGILPHSGVPGRRYYEIKDTIRELTPVMEDIHGIVPESPVGILFSYEEDWALTLQPQHPQMEYAQVILNYYRLLYNRGIPVTFLSPEGLDGCRMVFAPLLYLMSRELEDRLFAFVENGGTLVLTMRTGVMDMNNVCMADAPLPGRLAGIVGAQVEEYDALWWQKVSVRYADRTGQANKWCDILSPDSAAPLVFYDSEYYKGKPAVTVNAYGKGKVYYIGTELDDETMNWLLDGILEGVCRELPDLRSGSADVEMTVRQGREKDYLFILNHSEEKQTVAIPEGWAQEREVLMEPFGVMICGKKHK